MTTDLAALAKKATPGPWLSCECEKLLRTGDAYSADGYSTEFSGFEVIGQDDEVVHSPDDGIQKPEDAAYIAAASPDVILALIAERDALLERAEAAGDDPHDRWGILNHLGGVWSDETFSTDREASAYLERWVRDNPNMDLSKHRVAPVLVTTRAALSSQEKS